MGFKSKVGSTDGQRVNFEMNGFDLIPNTASKPFGYPPNADPPEATSLPMTESQLLSLSTNGVSSYFVMHDVDAQYDGTAVPPTWHDDLQATPVHGTTRNWLFFDWHVAATIKTNNF